MVLSRGGLAEGVAGHAERIDDRLAECSSLRGVEVSKEDRS